MYITLIKTISFYTNYVSLSMLNKINIFSTVMFFGTRNKSHCDVLFYILQKNRISTLAWHTTPYETETELNIYKSPTALPPGHILFFLCMRTFSTPDTWQWVRLNKMEVCKQGGRQTYKIQNHRTSPFLFCNYRSSFNQHRVIDRVSDSKSKGENTHSCVLNK